MGLGTISGTPVRGALAFHPNGRLIVPADNLVRGVDSSLPMPPGFALKGRGTLKYPFAPATRLRFNKWPGAGAQPATGFLFVAGKLNVPFFEDLPVLLHLEPANFLQSAHVMGGWPSDPSKPDRGWTVGGKNFFNSTLFDAVNLGYEGASLAAFRSGLDAGQKYRPHVHKDWQRIVDLEFPVQWNASSREFAAAGNQTMDLLVLSAQGQLKGLDAAGAEIEFGVKFNNKLVKLPNLNTQSFARALTDAGSLLTGSPEKKLANALTSALTTAISQPLIRDGTAALDHLLDDTLANLLDAPLRAGLDTPLDNLHAALKTIYASTGMAPGPLNAAPEVAQLKTALIAHLQSDLLAAANGPTSITGALDARLAQADAALTELEKLCYFDQPAVDGPAVVVPGQAQNPFLQAIARRALVEFYESDFTTTGSSAAQTAVRKLLKDLLEDARPILRQLTVAIGEARRAIRDMRDSLQGVGGASRNLRGQIEQVFTAANAASNFSTAAVDAFIVQITTSRDASGRWFDEVSPAQFRDRFGALLTDRFRSSALEQQIKQALKRLLDPVRQTAHNALNMVFGQVNNMVNQVVLELVKNFSAQLAGNAAFAELLNGGSALLNEAADGLGNFGKQYNDATKDVIRFAKVEGYARTRGDSLDELRVEAGIGLAVPDEIGASVFVLIKNVQSDMPSTSCRDPGAVATEVTIGANGGISIKSGNASEAPRPFKARLEGRFSFAGDFTPNGLDALIDLESDMDFGALTLKQVRMRLGLGGTEAYATAAARGSVWFVEGEARLFLGATRQLNILEESFDRETYDTVITRPMLPVQAGTRCLMHPVIGIYGQLGAHISVNRFFAIPDTCLLTLRAGRQLSEYVLLSDNASKLNAGIRDVLLINGTALCVGISGQAGLLFNAQLDTAALVKAEGIGSVLGSITGTARGWVEACVDLYFKKFCARADIIVGLKLNPPSFYPIAIEY